MNRKEKKMNHTENTSEDKKAAPGIIQRATPDILVEPSDADRCRPRFETQKANR